MARRRRLPVAEAGERVLPEELKAGPCVEVWGQGATGSAAYTSRNVEAAWLARERWHKAVDEWAASVGWGREDNPPALNALNQARMRRPWSREYLLRLGKRDLVDFLEGRRSDYEPDSDLGRWWVDDPGKHGPISHQIGIL